VAETYRNDWYDKLLSQSNETIQGETDYQTWSKTQVRAEAFHLIKAMDELARRQFVDHYTAHENMVATTSRLLNQVDSQEQEVTTMGGRIQNLANDLGSALQSLRFAVSDLDEKANRYEKEQKLDMSEIERVLRNHSVEISNNRDAIKNGYDSAAESLANMRREIGAILDKDRSDMVENDDDLRSKIAAMKQALQDDVGHLSQFADQVKEGLNAQVAKEAADVSDIQSKITDANNVIAEHSTGMEKIRGDQDSLKADTQSNANVLSSVQDKISEAQNRLSDLSKQLDRDDLVNKQALALASKTGEQISKQLDEATAQVSTVNGHLETLQRGDAALSAQEGSDFGGLHAALVTLQEQIKTADAIKNDLATLSSGTQAKIDQASSSISELAGQSKQLQNELTRQSSDLTGIVARVSVLEAANVRLKNKSEEHKAQIDSEVTAMQVRSVKYLSLCTCVTLNQGSRKGALVCV
jgi:chromosome segregation ATPase